ncbi:MAG: menaquinone biosynthesis protein [Acidobacteriota bacterium]
MNTPRISASSYSNTAPLVWSFLYGENQGKAELIMDTAPARSAELLAQDRVDAALVPVIAYQMIEGVRLIPEVCVGAAKSVRSVCLVTRGGELSEARSVSLDESSRTSAALSKIIFREFFGTEPLWAEASPDIDAMLETSDAALIIGDPALRLSSQKEGSKYRTFDLAELWRRYTGLGFVFAMWMTRRQNIAIDLAGARDEGLAHTDGIAANYASDTGLSRDEMKRYLTENISYTVDESMAAGMALYFELAAKHDLIARNERLRFI